MSSRDDVGNWPMELEVTGLPKQTERAAYYELWLTKGHKPVEPCGAFRVNGDKTTVRFTIPYDASKRRRLGRDRAAGTARTTRAPSS